MQRLPALVGLGLLAAALLIGAVACGDDDTDTGNLSDTPTAISQGTPSDSTEPAPGETEPAGGQTPDATSDGGGNTVRVNLVEYIVAPNPDSVPAGPVTFVAMNIGGNPHELVVIKTDLAPESLPTLDDGSFNGEGEGIEVIGETAEIPGGGDGEEELELELESGAYVLICNVVEDTNDTTTSHYEEGMSATFSVE